ncbi:MAG TPA: formylmethanofuran dehydrogenase, partial [Burkholderiaceae bacterium]|nr:formylmethanofuran dehydrogenase [Burkholderiaceae bacterium]
MSVRQTSPGPTPTPPWTCPFCPLLCDRFSVDAVAGGGWVLAGSDCPRATAALARFGAAAGAAAAPRIDGTACDLDAAIGAAAQRLGASRQPLFGGLGTDVAGARALYALACRTGAICDPAGGASLLKSLSALQDRGGFTATFAEVRARADLIVCIDALPDDHHPEWRHRVMRDSDPAKIVVLRGRGSAAPRGTDDVAVDADLFDATAMLAALVAQRSVATAPSALRDLAARLRQARYAVIVYETRRLPAHGALIVEAIGRSVATLNRATRAATLPLGGDDGASTVNAVFAWLSGLPLRSRAAPGGLEHEPLRFDATRLLADRAVDALLWIASFGTEPALPS